MMGNKGEAKRFNVGKTRHALAPTFAQEQYAKVWTNGAEKYGDFNWRKGLSWMSVMDSLQRHFEAVKRGEDFDGESGLLHTAHIMANAAMLTEYYKIFPQGDDRPHKYLTHPKVGFDIDEVLADFVGAYIKKYNFPYPSSRYFDSQMPSRFKEMTDNGTIDDFYMSFEPKIKPEDLAVEPACYITSRPVSSEVTKEWLDKHNFPARPVITVPLGTSKVGAVKESGVEIFIDDGYHNFVDINKSGTLCYLLTAPWNEKYNVGHKRLNSLSELKELI